MNKKIKYVISVFMYVVGFIGYLAFLSVLKGQFGTTAWWYGVGSCFGVLLFCMSFAVKKM